MIKRTKRRRPAPKRKAKKTRQAKKRMSGPVKKRSARKKAPAKRKRRTSAKKVIKQVEKRSVERVLAGKRRQRSRSRKRPVMAGTRRRRSVGKSGGSGLLIGVGLGALAIYLLTRKPAASTYNLPPVTQTQNLTRNNQTSDIVNYAIAGGMAIDAIIKLIGLLNSSSDSDVQDMHETMHTTGDLGIYI